MRVWLPSSNNIEPGCLAWSAMVSSCQWWNDLSRSKMLAVALMVIIFSSTGARQYMCIYFTRE
jgi:hypothetical protein